MLLLAESAGSHCAKHALQFYSCLHLESGLTSGVGGRQGVALHFNKHLETFGTEGCTNRTDQKWNNGA